MKCMMEEGDYNTNGLMTKYRTEIPLSSVFLEYVDGG